MSKRPLAANMLIDALTEFSRVIDALPAPGRGGAIGRLNPGIVTLLHITRDVETLRSTVTDEEIHPWFKEQLAKDKTLSFEDAIKIFEGVSNRMIAYLEMMTPADMEHDSVPLGIQENAKLDLADTKIEYHVAQTAAHLFVHMGELSALASLVGAPDLGLPGAMIATSGD